MRRQEFSFGGYSPEGLGVEFEYFAQFASLFLTSMFYGRGLCDIFGVKLSPLAHGWHRHGLLS